MTTAYAIVRFIPTYPHSELVTVFKALADPTRMSVVERLSVAPASVGELARPFPMALPSFMQHLSILEQAGIVSSHKTGRTRVYQLATDGLAAAGEWLDTHRNHWHRRLDQLDRLLTTDPTTDLITDEGEPR